MSRLILNKVAAPSTPSTSKGAIYLSNDANPLLRIIDDAGVNNNLTPIYNYSVASQSIPATTRTYLVGSNIKIPSVKLKIGTMFVWEFSATKTAAGLSSSTIDIAFGTTGTTSDTARVSFTKPGGSAVADEAFFIIRAIVRGPLSASGVVSGSMVMVHNLAATGHALIPTVTVLTISGAFDVITPTNVGLCLTTGASDAITLQMVTAEAVNL
jgi:hypothetical protein